MAEQASKRPIQAILVIGIVLVALVAVLFLFTVPFGNSDDDGVRVAGHPLLGEVAPEIDLETLDGDRVKLSELRGQPVLINFWATWCIPCREEFPLMVTAYEQHLGDGLEILGVVHDDTADGARAFAADLGAEWPMPFDAEDVAWEDYVGVGMPTSFFVDREGIVRAFSLGGFTETGLASQLDLILPELPPADPS